MITITSSNDEYAVTLNATPHGEYIKIEVEASRGWDGLLFKLSEAFRADTFHVYKQQRFAVV